MRAGGAVCCGLEVWRRAGQSAAVWRRAEPVLRSGGGWSDLLDEVEHEQAEGELHGAGEHEHEAGGGDPAGALGHAQLEGPGHRRRRGEQHDGREAKEHLAEVGAQDAAEHGRRPVGPAAQHGYLGQADPWPREDELDGLDEARVDPDRRAHVERAAEDLADALLLEHLRGELHEVREEGGVGAREPEPARRLAAEGLLARGHEEDARREVDG